MRRLKLIVLAEPAQNPLVFFLVQPKLVKSVLPPRPLPPDALDNRSCSLLLINYRTAVSSSIEDKFSRYLPSRLLSMFTPSKRNALDEQGVIGGIMVLSGIIVVALGILFSSAARRGLRFAHGKTIARPVRHTAATTCGSTMSAGRTVNRRVASSE